jgi:PAS domain S-box-containing protein
LVYEIPTPYLMHAMMIPLHILTIILFIASVAFVIKLIRITRHYTAWIFIITALLVLAFKNIYQLHMFLSHSREMHPTLTETIIPFVTAAMIFLGLLYISPLFKTIKKAMAQLEPFRLFYENAPLGYQSIDPEGYIVDVNAKWLEILNYQKEEAMGKWLGEFIASESIDYFSECFISCKQKGSIQGIKCWMKRKDQTKILCEFDGRITYDPYGNIKMVHCVFRDITEAEKIRKELEEHEKELRKSHNRLMELSRYQQQMIEKERSYLAYEIHDTLGQYLTSIHIGLSWLKNHLSADKPQIESKLKELKGLTNTTVKHMRNLSSKFRPKIIDDMGLIAAMEWHIKQFEKMSNIPCKTRIEEDNLPLANNEAINLFRILQEALMNVYKHACASSIWITLKYTDNVLFLQVQDNGRGMNRDTQRTTDCFGIIGMEERARLIGAQFNISSEEGSGTVIKIQLPLNHNQKK